MLENHVNIEFLAREYNVSTETIYTWLSNENEPHEIEKKKIIKELYGWNVTGLYLT